MNFPRRKREAEERREKTKDEKRIRSRREEKRRKESREAESRSRRERKRSSVEVEEKSRKKRLSLPSTTSSFLRKNNNQKLLSLCFFSSKNSKEEDTYSIDENLSRLVMNHMKHRKGNRTFSSTLEISKKFPRRMEKTVNQFQETKKIRRKKCFFTFFPYLEKYSLTRICLFSFLSLSFFQASTFFFVEKILNRFTVLPTIPIFSRAFTRNETSLRTRGSSAR